MHFCDPKPTKPYQWKRPGLQDGVPEGERRCRDCGHIWPEKLEFWKRKGLSWQQPCKPCIGKGKTT